MIKRIFISALTLCILLGIFFTAIILSGNVQDPEVLCRDWCSGFSESIDRDLVDSEVSGNYNNACVCFTSDSKTWNFDMDMLLRND